MQQFTKAGRITRDRHALRVEIDGRNGPGDLVIGAAAVSELLTGRRVDISFVQTPSPDRVFIGFSGEAWVSRSGKAITLRIGGVLYTAPLVQVRQVIAGTRAAAILSRPEPAGIIDADREQAKSIDHDLVRSFA
jgi:hypothetical protein